MPKQTFTMSDFSGGMNYQADPLDLVQKNQVRLAVNGHFDHFGKITYQSSDHGFTDVSVKNDSTNPTIADLDRGIGSISTDIFPDALAIMVSSVDPPASSDLSWEDGYYDFKYTVCKELGNGIIEEGPLQSFFQGGTNVDMTDDDKGKFTFAHSGTDHPDHMETSDYNGKLSARVYYSRRAGQGSATQVGWLHLCDLVQNAHNVAHSQRPRAVGLESEGSIEIDIEEPPTSSSFEMNAGYPSDVGVHNEAGDFGDEILAVVNLGMVKYIAATKDGKYYIYRSLPGQHDIWPRDNWIEMPEECVNMLGLGNYLCYWSTDSFIVFDVTKDTIVSKMEGLGLNNNQLASICGEAAVWAVGDPTTASKVYYFDGKLNEIGKGRIVGVQSGGGASSTAPKFFDNGWIYFDHMTETFDAVYSTISNTWFVLNYDIIEGQIYLPMIDFGELGRYKRIYSFTIYGGIGHIDSTNPIVTAVVDENHTSYFNYTRGTFVSAGVDFGSVKYTFNSSTKVRAIQITLNFHPDIAGFYDYKAIFQGISFEYRRLNKF